MGTTTATTGTTARTLVFDLGGVVLRWEPIELVREALAHQLPGADPAALTADLFGGFAPGGFWEQFDRGIIDRDEVARYMADGAGLEAAEVTRVLDSVGPHLALQPDAAALVERARAAGNRVVYLSNMPTPYADGLYPVLDPLFDGGVFSCRVREVKPDPQIFRVAEASLGLDPETLLFFDDREPNVDAAREVGWTAALYTSVTACEARLAADGWL